MGMSALLLHIIAVFFTSAVLLPVQAQQTDFDTQEAIQSFNVTYQINENGSFTVNEEILYDFGADERHGIYRSLPFLLTKDDGSLVQIRYDVQSVTDSEGKDYNYETSTQGERLQIKIGDPDTTITGVHLYRITYEVRGGLRYFADHDEFFWNITGNEWSIPIAQARTTIVLPETVATESVEAVCYTGEFGSTDQNCTIQQEVNQVTVTANTSFSAYQGLTVAVSFPKGIVAVLEPEPYVPFHETFWGRLLISSLILTALLWYVVYPLWLPIRWFLYGRDPFVGRPARAWYDPPESKTGRKLPPSETGTLIDEKAETREIVAMMVDLARRGFMTIKVEGKTAVTLHKTDPLTARNGKKGARKDELELDEIEAHFYNGLFGSKDTVDLKTKRLYSLITTVQDKIYTRLTKEDFFPEDPQKVRVFYSAMLGFAGATFNIPLLITGSLFGLNMARKTQHGAQMANVAKAMKTFLSSQERQLEYQADKQLFFERLLPYAIAFGVEKKWSERFPDISQPEWVEGDFANGFTTAYLVNNLNTTSTALATASTPPQSSSSSGFSGGSSGGGGGGGGGGSW